MPYTRVPAKGPHRSILAPLHPTSLVASAALNALADQAHRLREGWCVPRTHWSHAIKGAYALHRSALSGLAPYGQPARHPLRFRTRRGHPILGGAWADGSLVIGRRLTDGMVAVLPVVLRAPDHPPTGDLIWHDLPDAPFWEHQLSKGWWAGDAHALRHAPPAWRTLDGSLPHTWGQVERVLENLAVMRALSMHAWPRVCYATISGRTIARNGRLGSINLSWGDALPSPMPSPLPLNTSAHHLLQAARQWLDTHPQSPLAGLLGVRQTYAELGSETLGDTIGHLSFSPVSLSRHEILQRVSEWKKSQSFA